MSAHALSVRTCLQRAAGQEQAEEAAKGERNESESEAASLIMATSGCFMLLLIFGVPLRAQAQVNPQTEAKSACMLPLKKEIGA